MTPVEHGREARAEAQAPTILALETSTNACSVALSVGGTVSVDHRIAPRQHNQLVLSMIDSLLHGAGIEPRDLHAVAFGRGPGSFTGVRIAAGIAQGISFGLGIPVLPVSTLRVLALTAAMARTLPCNVLATIVARTNEVYVGGYRCTRDGCAVLIDDAVVRTAVLTLPEALAGDWCIAGDGAAYFGDVLARRQLQCVVDLAAVPSAEALLVLAADALRSGAGVDAAHALPVYLDGTQPWRKRVN